MEYADLIQKHEYELIVDEVIEPLELLEVPQEIARMLKESNTYTLNENGRVVWDERYKTAPVDSKSIERIRSLSDSRTLKELLDQKGQVRSFVKFHFFQMFHCYSKVHLLTYLFNGSKLKGMLQATNMEYDVQSIEQVEGEYILSDSF